MSIKALLTAAISWFRSFVCPSSPMSDDEAQPWENLSSLRRGQKDFEPDSTQVQTDTLNESLQSMYTSLSVPRLLTAKQNVKLYYDGQWRCELKGGFMQTMGVVRGQWCYLTEEEAVYLVERGTVEPLWIRGGEGEYVKMDLQSVYALCMTDMVRYQVYGNLKRCGYVVQRHQEREDNIAIAPWRLFKWNSLSDMISGLLWRFIPWKFTSYPMIFRSLQLNFTTRKTTPTPLEITYDVWKPHPNFSKKLPPKPDFQIMCVDISSSRLPTASQLKELFNRTNGTAILALVDSGVISYMKLTEGDFKPLDMTYGKRY